MLQLHRRRPDDSVPDETNVPLCSGKGVERGKSTDWQWLSFGMNAETMLVAEVIASNTGSIEGRGRRPILMVIVALLLLGDR